MNLLALLALLALLGPLGPPGPLFLTALKKMSFCLYSNQNWVGAIAPIPGP